MKNAMLLMLVSIVVGGNASGDEPRTLTDEFEEAFGLSWEIENEDATKYSLATHPGELSLTTGPGSIYNTNESGWTKPPKNVFLLKEAIPTKADFEATLHVNVFEPNAHYQQIALLFYQSDQQYLKWGMTCRQSGDPRTRLEVVTEEANKAAEGSPKQMAVDGPFWLRVSRVGGEYRFAYSNDGDEYSVIASRTWASDANLGAPRIGFVAKNGNPRTEETVVVVESFRLVVSADE